MLTRFRRRENGANRVVSGDAVLNQIRVPLQEAASERLLILAVLHTAQATAQYVDYRLLR